MATLLLKSTLANSYSGWRYFLMNLSSPVVNIYPDGRTATKF